MCTNVENQTWTFCVKIHSVNHNATFHRLLQEGAHKAPTWFHFLNENKWYVKKIQNNFASDFFNLFDGRREEMCYGSNRNCLALLLREKMHLKQKH